MMPNDEMDAPLAPLVLVVEDDPDVRRIAADIFHEAELKTAEASTAEEALASSVSTRPMYDWFSLT